MTYWGQFPTQWGTSTTTTTDNTRRNRGTDEHPENARDIVFIVAPEEPSISIRPRDFRYRVSSLSKLLPRMFILEAPSGTLAGKSTAESVALSAEIHPSAWRGIL